MILRSWFRSETQKKNFSNYFLRVISPWHCTPFWPTIWTYIWHTHTHIYIYTYLYVYICIIILYYIILFILYILYVYILTFYIDILSGTCSDILSGIFSFWHSLCSGPGPTHSVRSSRYEVRRRAGTPVDKREIEEKKRKEKELHLC